MRGQGISGRVRFDSRKPKDAGDIGLDRRDFPWHHIYIFTATKHTGQMAESVEGLLRWHWIDDLWKLKRLAEHQRWFLDHILNDEGYFYYGAAVYQDGGWVRYADSQDASFVRGNV